jgi:probable HAF family extracellular repeat protein
MLILALMLAAAQLDQPPASARLKSMPRFIDIGAFPGGSFVWPNAISADGSTVVGTSEGYPVQGAFRWQKSTGMVSLAPDPMSTSSSWDVTPNGALCVGRYNYDAVVWDASGKMTPLGKLPQLPVLSDYLASGVSDDGTTIIGIGGWWPENEGFVWTANSGMRAMDDGLEWEYVYPWDVSSDGRVAVGEAGLRRVVHFALPRAFRWTQELGVQDLGAFEPGWMSSAEAISGDGSTIVGWSGKGMGTDDHACRWTASIGIQDLGELPDDVWSEALDTNRDGTVIVGVSLLDPGTQRAFLWTERDGMHDLNQYLQSIGLPLSDWILMWATAVSADGTRIAGWGYHNGKIRAWLVELD